MNHFPKETGMAGYDPDELRAVVRRRLAGHTLRQIDNATSETGAWKYRVENADMADQHHQAEVLAKAETELAEHERIAQLMRTVGMDVYDPARDSFAQREGS